MEFVKNTTALICILSLIFAALSGIVSLEKYTFAIKTIISSIMILYIIKPIASENFSFEPLFENSSITDASIYDYDDAVINEAVRVQTKINLEKAACQILSDYEVRYKDLKFDVNIDA